VRTGERQSGAGAQARQRHLDGAHARSFASLPWAGRLHTRMTATPWMFEASSLLMWDTVRSRNISAPN
jgi:hypothetical protein